MKCKNCDGTGMVTSPWHGAPCSACKGSGEAPENVTGSKSLFDVCVPQEKIQKLQDKIVARNLLGAEELNLFRELRDINCYCGFGDSITNAQPNHDKGCNQELFEKVVKHIDAMAKLKCYQPEPPTKAGGIDIEPGEKVLFYTTSGNSFEGVVQVVAGPWIGLEGGTCIALGNVERFKRLK